MSSKSRSWFRIFLDIGLILSLAIAILISSLPESVSIQRSRELRGVWLTNVASSVLFMPGGIHRAVEQLREANFNTVYPVVWNRGNTFYPSQIAEKAIGQKQDPLLNIMRLGSDILAQFIEQGHYYGLKVIPWFEYGLMTPKNSRLARQHPEWLTQSQDQKPVDYQDELEAQELGKQPHSQIINWFRDRLAIHQSWLNPLHPEVKEFIKGIIIEVVKKYDIDGVQIDDHFGMPVEMGYDPLTIKLYQEEHNGRKPPKDIRNEEWMKWRADKITELMREIYWEVKEVKPDCIVSLSPNSHWFSYQNYLQDWQEWVKRGVIDELILQVYRFDREKFIKELEQPAVTFAKWRIPVSIAILSGTLNKPVGIKQIEEQVQIVRDYNFSGVAFFYWESLWGYIAPEAPQTRREAFKKLFMRSR